MPYNDPRDEVTDALMKGKSSFDYGLAGLGSAQQPMASMTAGPQLTGLPQTPSGGVPGSGLATAGPSTVQLPPQRPGMQGGMPSMPMMGGLGAPQRMGGMPQLGSGQISNADMIAAQRAAAQGPALPTEIGSGQISNADMIAAQKAAARRPRGY